MVTPKVCKFEYGNRQLSYQFASEHEIRMGERLGRKILRRGYTDTIPCPYLQDWQGNAKFDRMSGPRNRIFLAVYLLE